MILPDGFVPIDANALDSLNQTEFAVDEFSPFADSAALWPRGENLIMDQYYGQVYHTMELRPAAIYGRTDDLPEYSGDHLANNGFLRVPFRRIPRHVVGSRAEIEALLASIQSVDDNLVMLFRGQSIEHLIVRSPETTQWLYGEDAVCEPSLRTSASRRKPALEEVLPEWTLLLKLFLASQSAELSSSDYREFTTSYIFPMYALSLAQHYGLPTSGLDLTSSLEVAIFFALNRFEKARTTYSGTYSRLKDSCHMPVLYLLSPGRQQHFDYEGFRRERAPTLYGRPAAQSACFMHIGWGNAENACARRIFLALYLDPAGDFEPFPSSAELFPSNERDRFAAFLENLSSRSLPEKLGRVLEGGFYTIA